MGSTEISKATRERIFALAKEYGCFNKYHTDTYKKKIIAVISTEQKRNVWSEGIEYLERKIDNAGYLMVLSFSNFSNENVKNQLEDFSEYAKVDGIILLNSSFDIPLNYSAPIVSVQSKTCQSGYDRFIVPCTEAIDSAVRYFYEMGHREIAYIGEMLTAGTRTCFLNAMQIYGLKINEDFILTSYCKA